MNGLMHPMGKKVISTMSIWQNASEQIKSLCENAIKNEAKMNGKTYHSRKEL